MAQLSGEVESWSEAVEVVTPIHTTGPESGLSGIGTLVGVARLISSTIRLETSGGDTAVADDVAPDGDSPTGGPSEPAPAPAEDVDMDDDTVQPAHRTRKRREAVHTSQAPPPAPATKKTNRRRKGEDDDDEDQGDGSDYVETDVDADELDEEEEEPDEKFSDEGDEEEDGDDGDASKPLKASTQRQLDYLAEGVSPLSLIEVDDALTRH